MDGGWDLRTLTYTIMKWPSTSIFSTTARPSARINRLSSRRTNQKGKRNQILDHKTQANPHSPRRPLLKYQEVPLMHSDLPSSPYATSNSDIGKHRKCELDEFALILDAV